MITHSDAEQRIERWLAATAPVGSADRVLAETFDRTRGLARRSGSPRPSVSIRRRPIAFAVVAAVILVAVSFGIRRTDLAQAAPLGSIDGQRWVDSNEVAVTIERDPSDEREFYWRAAAYDQIGRVGVSIGHPMTTARPPATSLLAGMADDVDPAGQDRLTFTVHPVSLTSPLVLSPATPILVDRDVRLTTVGQDGYFAMAELANMDTYTVTALVPSGGTASGSTDTSALRAAGTAYPVEVVTLYTAEQTGVVGPNLRALKDEVVRTAASTAPIDRVERLLQVLGAPPYTYDVNAGSIGCVTTSVAECFATSKHGFCVQYATTMAVVLREMGIPARVVEGFLPGTRKAGSARGGHPQRERPCLGGGVLPRPRLGRVRPDKQDPADDRAEVSLVSRSARSGSAC